MTRPVALYLRVSTDSQDTANQRLELERWAAARGYQVVATFEDAGLSGSLGRDRRPAFDAALKAAVRREFDILAAWDVTRIGRSLLDVLTAMNELRSVGCDLFLAQQSFDTSSAFGRMALQVGAAFGEWEREILRERIHAGITRARAQGTKSGKPIGRPGLPHTVREAALQALRSGASVRVACRASGASVGAVGQMRKELLASGQIAAQ